MPAHDDVHAMAARGEGIRKAHGIGGNTGAGELEEEHGDAPTRRPLACLSAPPRWRRCVVHGWWLWTMRTTNRSTTMRARHWPEGPLQYDWAIRLA
jgi:hypothetical protein